MLGVITVIVLAGLVPTATAATNSEKPVRLRVAVSGDLLIHSPVFNRARANGGGRRYDFAPMFRHLRPYLREADLAICHVETPMTSRPPSGYPLFNTPPAIARAIASAGWDACSTASNHTLDQGQFGVDATIGSLARAGVAHAGSYRSAAAQRRPAILTVQGLRVALSSYTEHTNGLALPAPWSVNLARAEPILAEARRAPRAARGSAGRHRQRARRRRVPPRPSALQRRLGRRLLRSRTITAVIGQHPHVVQPITEISGRLVVYGAGNLISNQSAACCPAATQDGVIAMLQIEWDSRRAAHELHASATSRPGCAIPTTRCCPSATPPAAGLPTAPRCARHTTAPSPSSGAAGAYSPSPRALPEAQPSRPTWNSVRRQGARHECARPSDAPA